MTDTRCACGYARSLHEATGHCPLCACGKLPDEHGPVTTPPSPLRAFGWFGPVADPPSPLVGEFVVTEHRAPKVEHVCPGKPLTAAGNLPTLRRGSFTAPEPDPPRREWFGMLVPVIAGADEVAEPEQVAPPLIPARQAHSEAEIAPRALPVGNRAADLGWRVVPWFWQAGDRVETCALVMWRGELRAVAYWHRAPGAGWKTGGALGWQVGQWPRAVSITALVKFLDELGAPA